MEECITTELKHFSDSLVETAGQPIDMKNLLIQAVSNVATSIIFGSRFPYTEDQLENLQFDEYVQKAIRVAPMPILKVC